LAPVKIIKESEIAMRLNYLWIEDFKNLQDVLIDFDEENWVTVLIGWNGSGKSNVIEALSIIFRDLIYTSKKDGAQFSPVFSYHIYYECAGNSIFVAANSSERGAKSVTIRSQEKKAAFWSYDKADLERGKNIRLSQLSEEGCVYVPKYVFGYYSGESDRLQSSFRRYLQDFDGQMRAGKDPGLKRFFYAMPVHSNFVLLSFILQHESVVNNFLINELGLDSRSGIDSILFVMQEPPWNSSDGDPRFWNARGIVSDFLDRLYNVSIAPFRLYRKTPSSLWNKSTREFLYLYVKNVDALYKLAKGQSPREFFRD
jgi:energy-coupling factor transporter ATP-binding protein EcfA2